MRNGSKNKRTFRYYYHFRKLHGFKGTLYQFLESDLRDVEWDEHVNAWLYQNPSLENICVVRYEDMLDDTFQEIEKLVHFIGFQRSEEQIFNAISNSSFDKMKKIEKEKGLGYVNTGNSQIRFVRKGTSGSWVEEFDEREKALFKESYGDELVKSGYESSFDW